MNGSLIKSINPNNYLKEPLGLCVETKSNGDEIVYVSDWKAHTVFVFNYNFKLITRIGQNLNFVSYITIDSESGILYISHTYENKVSLWNVKSGKLFQKLFIEQPLHSKLRNSSIYILCMVGCKLDNDQRKLIKLKKGNCIDVINKLTLEIIHRIKFDDWLAPHFLYLSPHDSTIYTIAFPIYENGTYSRTRFLFKIQKRQIDGKKSFEVKQKIRLNDVNIFNDALCLDNKLIICGANANMNEIRFIEFS